MENKITLLEERIEFLEKQLSRLNKIIKYSNINYDTCPECDKILNRDRICRGCDKIICSKCEPFYFDPEYERFCNIKCAKEHYIEAFRYATGGYGPDNETVHLAMEYFAKKENKF